MMEQKIFQAITDIMSEVGAIGKEKRNQQQGFMYRGIDDVMNALQPLLTKHKVFVVPEVLEQNRTERETKSGGVLFYSICKIKYTFYADDGSSITSVVVGEGMDSGDKATNKAMSIAFKYACFQVFCIPTEEMSDPDKDTPEQTKKTKAETTTKEKPAVQQPSAHPTSEVISEAQRKRLFAICNDQEKLKGIIAKRGYESSKTILKADYDAICKEAQG